MMVLVAAAVSGLVMLGQLRALGERFDLLTDAYVVFNQRLAEAHVQSVRVYELVRSHQARSQAAPERPDAAFLHNFEASLRALSTELQAAREPIDDALDPAGRFGGGQRDDLLAIQSSLDALEAMTAADELDDPLEVLEASPTEQAQIDQLFKSLAAQSKQAIEVLRDQVATARQRTEELTIATVFAVTLLVGVAAVGAFLTLRPLRQLAQRVRDLGRGDWSQRVTIAGSRREDEVGQLAAEFNLMAEALEERERRLLRGERLAAAGQLAAQITHEIRNPLSSVALNVDLLEDELTGASPEGRHLLREITKEVDRLTAVTEDYLGFARRAPPELHAIDLRSVLAALLEFMGPELRHAGVELRVDLGEAKREVMGDTNQLRQAFMNLVRNAMDAALDDESREDGRSPRICVTLEHRGDRVLVSVADNGPGIGLPAANMDRVFEAFYTRKARGTGLGLPIVHQILADHDGTVRVAVTGAEGTRFEVDLPACDPDGSNVGSHPAAVAPSS